MVNSGIKAKTKRGTAAVLSLVMVLAMLLTGFSSGLYGIKAYAETPEGFAGGDGTVANPWQIADAAQLDLLRNYLGEEHLNKHFVLTGDIDLTAYLADGGVGYDKWGAAGWEPIVSNVLSATRFCGTLDGAGYAVTGLWINRENTRDVGLFGATGTGSLIQNLGVVIDDAKGGVTGSATVGGLVGAQYGSIMGSYTTGNVTGTGNCVGGLVGDQLGSITSSYATGSVNGNIYVGGLVGFQNDGSIENCYATGSVTGENTVGGLLGQQSGGSITGSYAAGNVIGTGNYVGGLVGYQSTVGSIENCYATGSMTAGNDYVGGLVGQQNGSIENSHATGSVTGNNQVGGLVGRQYSGSITGSFFDNTVNNTLNGVGSNSTATGVTGKSTADMKKQITFTGWDFTGADSNPPMWYIFEDISYPLLFWQIAADGAGTDSDPFIIKTPTQLDNMRMFLGSDHSEKHFKLGNDIDISGYGHTWDVHAGDPIVTTSPGWNPIGSSVSSDTRFYGTLDGAGYTVTGLWINRKTTNDVGLFGVTGSSSLIQNLGVVMDDAKGGVTGSYQVGGLVGCQNGSNNIENCYASGSVTGVDQVGGLVGVQNGSIENSYATGSVTGTGSNAGGLVGTQYGGSNIENSHATGSVTGNNQIGGLVGWQDGGSIADSYAAGSVTGKDNVGGLVGYQRGSIENSYATGSVTGNNYVGGLVGYQDSGSITDCFFDKTVNGTITGVGSNSTATGVSGKTTAELSAKSTFDGWDFDSVWGIYDGKDYPYLLSFGNHILAVPAGTLSREYDGTSDTPGVTFNIIEDNDNYDENDPLTGAFQITGVDAGTHNFTTGTLSGPVYQLRTDRSETYTITQKALTVTGAVVADKTYDGTSAAEVTAKGTLEGKLGDDIVDFTVSAVFADANAGDDKTVTITYTLTGADAGNYSILPGTFTKDIGKATPVVNTPPAAANLYKGTALSGSALSGGSTQGSLTGRFEWVDPTASATATGSFSAVFVPDDTDNYNNSDPVLITVTVLDKTALDALITSATNTKNGAVIGDGNGEYAQQDVDTLNAAIEAAQAISSRSAADNSQDDIDAAVNALQAAVDTFSGAANVTDYNVLQALIQTASVKKTGSTYGLRNGDYASEQENTLGSAITAAQTVADNSSATQTQVNDAVTALQTAVNRFNATLVTVDYTALNDMIDLCRPVHDGAVEGDGNGQYEDGSKAIFQAAIDTAQTVAGNDRATQAEVDSTRSTLEAALNTFAIKKVGVNYDILKGLITQAQDKAKNSIYGDKNGDYPQSAKDALEAAVTAAQAVAGNSSATQTQMNDAVTALQAAVDTFNNSKIAVNYQNLRDLFQTAINTKAQSTQGDGNGQYPAAAMIALQAAIDTTQTVADDSYLSQQTVNDAYRALNEALSVFHASKITVDGTSLEEVIGEAEKLSNDADIGDKPGQYPKDAADKLKEAINIAKETAEKNGVTQVELDRAAEDLQEAIELFKDSTVSDPSPNTSDNSNLTIWLMLCGASLTVLALTFKRKKRTITK